MGDTMATSFQRRRLRFVIQLAEGTFNKEGNPDTITLEDFRSHVEIQAMGGFMFAACKATIYGIAKETMDRLTFINLLSLDFRRNTVRVEAADDNGEFSVIFFGEILQSSPNYDSAPSVPLVLEARSGVIGSLRPTNPDTFPGPQRVDVMLTRVAMELGLKLENNGVDTILTDMVLTGSANEKVRAIQEAADIQVWNLYEEGVLAIAPLGKPRISEPILYSALTGMIRYPTRLHNGVIWQALFNPATRHGCKVEIESDVPLANGEWYVISMTHVLSCNEPGGPWFTDFAASPQGMYIGTR